MNFDRRKSEKKVHFWFQTLSGEPNATLCCRIERRQKNFKATNDANEVTCGLCQPFADAYLQSSAKSKLSSTTCESCHHKNYFIRLTKCPNCGVLYNSEEQKRAVESTQHVQSFDYSAIESLVLSKSPVDGSGRTSS